MAELGIEGFARSFEAERALDRLKPGAAGAPHERRDLRDAAVEFEGYFLKLVLEELRKGSEASSFTGGDWIGGSSAGQYRALLDDALARHTARAGGVGLADQLVKQWEGL